jgi:hypothetical protein
MAVPPDQHTFADMDVEARFRSGCRGAVPVFRIRGVEQPLLAVKSPLSYHYFNIDENHPPASRT